jgi:hypothetical protein
MDHSRGEARPCTLHARLEATGAEKEEIVNQIDGLEQAAIPLLDGIVVHHEHLLLALIEDAYVHLVDAFLGAGDAPTTPTATPWAQWSARTPANGPTRYSNVGGYGPEGHRFESCRAR